MTVGQVKYDLLHAESRKLDMLFTIGALTKSEQGVIARIDDLRGKLRYVTRDTRQWTGLLRRSTLARAIRGSNTIEGFNVSVEDAIAAAVDEDPLDASREVWQAIMGYRNAMTYILQLGDDPHFTYSENLLRSLHYMMMHYDLPKHPGRWRPGVVFVRNEGSGEIVYEGPDVDLVPGLMHELTTSLNGTDDSPAMIRAAMGHLNLTMIHPFSDGNGRMARALQTLILAREGILVPQFCSIEEYLGRNTQEYYKILSGVGKGAWHPKRDARPWIRFCLIAHFRQATTLLRRAKENARVWTELESEITRRSLPEQMILALHDAAFGYRVRNSTYRSAAGISLNLASRHLKLLSDSSLLIPRGQGRGRFYIASDLILSIRVRAREPRSDEDPFETKQAYLPGFTPT